MKLSKKNILFPLLILSAFRAKAQELLNTNENQIKKYMNAKGGILKFEELQNDEVLGGRYNELIYTFPKSKVEVSDILFMTFYLTVKNKCVRYFTAYKTNKFLKDLINNFDNPNSGLTRIDKTMKWINKNKNYEIEILTSRFSSRKSTAFVLDIYQKE
jgi:hypothetical protein